ncbi:alpha/beta fold hydrolase [Tundrisphaera lichenicola]|uniref:alpha/beta fold hydrolase n=1 Tax=Tundrisphaera lichenicola TaxID=2029860 RepID=UPI003EBB7CDE
MPFMPFNILGMWFRGLLSIAILAGGIYLLKRWYDDSHFVEVVIPAGEKVGSDRWKELVLEGVNDGSARRVFRFDPGWNQPTGELAAASALILWATLGRWIGNGLSLLTLRSGKPAGKVAPRPAGKRESKKIRRQKPKRQKSVLPLGPEEDEDPSSDRTGEVHTIRRPDGSELRVECYGPADAPPIIWTHGWGANSTEWFYQKRHLTDQFRLIVWDEPGLGLSKKPDNNDYRLENLASDLEAVLDFAGDRPALLVGHSIGGMITLTFCKLFPEKLGTRVNGLVLAHTSYTNPVRTTSMAGFYTAIEKPVVIPLLYLTIGLWPLAWLMNWMSYFNGSAHRSTHKSSFSGNETRGQLNFVSRFMPLGRPDVLARGMLGMIAYDATEVLARIPVPTLVFVGDEDTTTLPEAGEFIANHVPRAKLVTLSPAKHMGLLEHHDQFDRVVAEFAESCQPMAVRG